ncbi:SDR family NAD(P)-dependent oxidoreductase [Trebonia kvetii]|uniref:SDR family NAD(P)-dependent oxidoreductase n=1 Tax=Trebonia kvetii TaxID=2480626 RepID=A0A6P2BVF5_9ACTN|nr:SDR family NAD(P)-dependent oxidoreductase [Trebonia kvetii]TVZ02216.1 SDR family NAD(P)-dependent oxidoreductase [Trebonia kvetii]
MTGDSLPPESAEQRFRGGTAVVTGGGAGIGEGLVRYLCRIGMRVVIADIDTTRATALAQELTRDGGDAIPRTVDVTDAVAVEELARSTFDAHGSVELLINNAGLETAGLAWEVTVERWQRLMAVNLDGVFFGIRAFVPKMIAAGEPAVIANLSSIGGISTMPMQAPYIASKHAVLALTECLHQEILLTGAPIQVSAILPYSVRSQIFLDAQRDAPVGNRAANQLFAAMQKDNEETSLDPVKAAEHMVGALARGEFWVFSDDERCRAVAARRARLLAELTPPADPRPRLAEMGVTL